MRERLGKITAKDMANVIMKNEGNDIEKMIENTGVLSEEPLED